MLGFTYSPAPREFLVLPHERSAALLEETSAIDKHLPFIGLQRGLCSRRHGLPLGGNGSLLLHPLEEHLVVLANRDRLRMLRAERLLADDQSPLVEGLGLLVLALLLIERCQVIQRLCHLRVRVSQRLFLDGQSLLQESFGLFLPSLP